MNLILAPQYQAELNLQPVVRLERNCDVDDGLLAKWEQLGNSCRKATFPIVSELSP